MSQNGNIPNVWNLIHQTVFKSTSKRMIRIECIEGVYSRDIFELQISASPWSHGRSFETKQRSLCTKSNFLNRISLYKRLTVQRSESTNVWLTNVGLAQTSDWNRRRTGTNVGLVHTSDWYIRRTETNVKLVKLHTLDGFIYKEKVGLWLSLKKIT